MAQNLSKGAGMRLTSWCLICCSLSAVAACTRTSEDDAPAITDPDAGITTINCEGGFSFVAPQPGLHYDTNLIVITDMDPFYASGLPGVVAVDDLNRGYEPTATPTKAQLPNGLVEMRWPMTLAPDRRYELYFMATECEGNVTFFTSSQ